MRRCPKCEEIKADDQFYSAKCYCKPCWNLYMLDWNRSHPQSARERSRRWADKAGRDGIAKKNAEWRSRNPGWWKKYHDPKRKSAKDAVYLAVKSGRLIRPERCSACQVRGPVEAHHENYDNKLDVSWLCKACHGLTRRLGKKTFI